MKRKHRLSCAAALGFFLLPALAVWTQSQDQPSLGDVARQKSAAKARRVVTNDEIPPSPEANHPPSPAGESSGAAAKPSAALEDKAASTPEAKQDVAKTNPSQDKQTKLQELMTDRKNLEKILKKMQDKFAETNDEPRKTTLGEVVQHTKDALDENQKQIDKLRAANPAAANQPAVPSPPPSAPPR